MKKIILSVGNVLLEILFIFEFIAIFIISAIVALGFHDNGFAIILVPLVFFALFVIFIISNYLLCLIIDFCENHRIIAESLKKIADNNTKTNINTEGLSVTTVEENEKQETNICPSCGKKYNEKDVYCQNCGTKLK